MKSREALIRSRQFEVEDRRRKLAAIERMISDFNRMADDLDQQIEAEEQRTGVRDSAHFAYSPFAKAAGLRRDNLLTSADDLKAKLEAARLDLAGAEEELARAGAIEDRVEEQSRYGRRPSSRRRVGHNGVGLR